MLDLSTLKIVIFFAVYAVSAFYLLLKQEETEIVYGQKITYWDRIPVFVPLINTLFASWAFIYSYGNKQNHYNKGN